MAGVPASGVGPGDLKSNSGACERSLGAARSIDPVFYPYSGARQMNQSPEDSVRFSQGNGSDWRRRSEGCLQI